MRQWSLWCPQSAISPWARKLAELNRKNTSDQMFQIEGKIGFILMSKDFLESCAISEIEKTPLAITIDTKSGVMSHIGTKLH